MRSRCGIIPNMIEGKMRRETLFFSHYRSFHGNAAGFPMPLHDIYSLSCREDPKSCDSTTVQADMGLQFVGIMFIISKEMETSAQTAFP